MKSIRLMLADDHPVYRDGLRMMLEMDEDIEVVAEASNGRETIRVAAETQPDLVLLDINLPDMSGALVAEGLTKLNPAPAIMFVTMEKSGTVLQQALELDIAGYLLKNSGAREIIEAVHTVRSGEKYYSPPVAQMLVDRMKASRSIEDKVEGIGSLTPTERKVLRLVASDRTSKEIASDLGVSVRTIEGHRANITRKLGLSGAHSLVKFAFEHRDSL